MLSFEVQNLEIVAKLLTYPDFDDSDDDDDNVHNNFDEQKLSENSMQTLARYSNSKKLSLHEIEFRVGKRKAIPNLKGH